MIDLIPGYINHFTGKTHSEESKQKVSKANKGKCAGEKNPMFGKKQTEETREKISMKQRGIPKPRFTCEKCGANIGGKSNFLRYHGENCYRI